MAPHRSSPRRGPGHIRSVATLGVTVLLSIVASTTSGLTAARAVVVCHKWAAPTGNDLTGDGSQANPYRHLPKLIKSLAPGQTGCLAPGQTFVEDIGYGVTSAAGGTSAAPVTIRTGGSPRAVVKAGIQLNPDTHDIVFTDIAFTDSYPGAGPGSVMVNVMGDRIEFRDTEMTFLRGICFSVGELDGQGGGLGHTSVGVVVDSSRIHDCGMGETEAELGESGVHGIYAKNSRGLKVTNDLIYENVNRGVQLYPNADGSLIANNVLDGNGADLNIGSYTPTAYFSTDNVVRNNVVSNSDLNALIDPNWPAGDTVQFNGNFPKDGIDRGNVVKDNCFAPWGAGDARNFGGWGYVESGTVYTADPLFVDRPNRDFRLQPQSPCAGMGPAGTQPLISIADNLMDEGNAGSKKFLLTVSLTIPSAQTVTVTYATANGSATAPSDYTAVPPTILTFGPGQVSRQVTVLVMGDTVAEPNETFTVNLSAPTNATIGDATGQARIRNDDSAWVRPGSVLEAAAEPGSASPSSRPAPIGVPCGTSSDEQRRPAC